MSILLIYSQMIIMKTHIWNNTMKRLFFVILFAIATANLYAQYFMADTVKLNATYRGLIRMIKKEEKIYILQDTNMYMLFNIN